MLNGLIASIKASGKRLDDMRDLFVEELKDLYDVENQIIDALPKMIDGASSPQLKQAFQQHLQTTRLQKDRLEQLFRRLNMKPERETCAGIRGILMEGEILLKADGDPKVKDATLIAAAQRVEHYEMAAYGSLRSFARQIARDDLADIIQQTLDEEGDTDKRLTDIAMTVVNPQARRAS
jgi:ferritin-like metal-binding protein YciE